MKTVQTFLLFILLIAVGRYPQVVSATGIEIEPTEAWTDTIQHEGLTTVTPNEEEKFTATPLEPQNSVIILQLSIESNITVNSSSNDSVQPTYPTSTAQNSDTTTDKINETVTITESDSIVYIPEGESTPESAADLPLPINSSSLESVSTDTESKSTTGVPELEPTTETTNLVSSSTEVAQIIDDPKNTTGETSSTPESSSELPIPIEASSIQSLPTLSEGAESKSSNNVLTIPESIPETTEIAETTSDSENTSSIPIESESDIESSSQSSLSTASGAPETISLSAETTLSPTQLSEGSTTVASTESKLNGLEDTGNSSGTEKIGATKHGEVDSTPVVSEPVSEEDVGASKTAESLNNEEPDGVLVAHLPAVPVSSSITETDQAAVATRTETIDVVPISNTNTTDAAETSETSTGSAEIPSHSPEDPLNPSEVTAAPSTAPESDPASSLPTDPSTSESIPASTERTQTSSDSETTSSTPSESRSASESASESPIPPASQESTIPSIEASTPFPCNETGNFPNPANCLTYISCTGNTTDLLSQEIQCPDRSAFSPVLQRCTRDISPCNDEPPCSYAGSVADPTNSSSYYWCVPSLLGGFHKYHIQCSIDETFNALFGRCFLNTPTYGLIKPSSGIPNDRDIAKAESKQMKKEIKAKAKEEKNRQKMAAKAKADAEKLALKQQKKQNYCMADSSDD